MSDSLLLNLGGDAAEARRRAEEVIGDRVAAVVSLSELRAGTKRVPSGCDLSLVGSPPEDEIGWGLVPFVALATRAERVTLIDTRRGAIRSRRLRTFLRSALPAGLAQLVSSAAALAAQRGLAAGLERLGAPRTCPISGPLREMLYIRPLVGVPVPFGGSVTHTHEVIRGLSDFGVSVEGLTTDPLIAHASLRESRPPCRWKVVRAPRLLRGVPASAGLAGDAALLRAGLPAAQRTDLIYQRHTRFSLAGALLARAAGRPFFLEYNGSEAFFGEHWQPTPFAGQLLACEEAALRAATRVVVVAEAERRALLGRGVERERILVNPNGVDPSRFVEGSGAALRRSLGFREEELVVGFVGSFGPWHGAPVLARAFGRISEEEPHARLLFVGEGPQQHDVRKVLREQGIEHRVHFAGRVEPAEVPRYLDACDVLASPHVQLPGGTEFFGSPTKLFEYMATGRPIVASRLGQIGEVLEHERTALLVTPGDPVEIARGVVTLARDPELGRRLGQAARSDAVERHSWRQNAERLRDAYAELSVGA